MTVKQLIEKLQELNEPDAIIYKEEADYPYNILAAYDIKLEDEKVILR